MCIKWTLFATYFLYIVTTLPYFLVLFFSPPMLIQNTNLSYYRKDSHFLGLVSLERIPEQTVRMIFLWIQKSEQLTGLESFLYSPCTSIQHSFSFVSVCQPSLCTYSPWVTLPVNLFKSSQLLINHFVSLFVSRARTGREPDFCCRYWEKVTELCKRCCHLVLS